MPRKDEVIDDLRVDVSMQSGEMLLEEPTPPTLPKTSLIYGLEAVPPITETIFAALQHVLACFVGIVTPSLIIGGALQLPPETVAYLVSMSLFVSGIATFIQVKKIGPVGSGLLSIQGTSFAFIGPIIAAGGAAAAAGATPEQALGTIFCMCFAGSFIEMFLSSFCSLPPKLSRLW